MLTIFFGFTAITDSKSEMLSIVHHTQGGGLKIQDSHLKLKEKWLGHCAHDRKIVVSLDGSVDAFTS